MLQIRRDIKYPKSKTPERYRIKAKPCKLIMDCIALSSGPSPENRENSVVVEPSGAAEKCKKIYVKYVNRIITAATVFNRASRTEGLCIM